MPLKETIMPVPDILKDPGQFSEALYEKMKLVNPGIAGMDLYEFRYGLDNLVPKDGGWAAVVPLEASEMDRRIQSGQIFSGIQYKPQADNRIVLDERIANLTNMLLVGLGTGIYPLEWIQRRFYFDVRGFFFLVRIEYFTAAVKNHFGGTPYQCFEPKQKLFEANLEIGYKDFREANAEVDQLFIASVHKIIAAKGTPIVLAIAGPTAAGKTEIVARLRASLQRSGMGSTAIEMDHFLTDRDQREEKGVGSLGKEAIHFDLFRQCLEDISQGKKVVTPRYDFIIATSSHALDGSLKPGASPIEIEPADIVFVEGNFPFLLPETARLIQIKVVYLTDDAVRLKRKWRRDLDYRKKYDPSYLRNRYFKDQPRMAYQCFIPQMEVCDMVVDTTGASLWVTEAIQRLIL